MKIFAFTDLHSDIKTLKNIKERIKKGKPDIIFCAGDITFIEQNIKELLQKINQLGKVYLIHGNHESEAILKKACSYFDNLEFVHRRQITVKGVDIIGWGGGGFIQEDKGFEKWSKTLRLDKKTVFLCHMPFFKTKLDLVYKEHRGNKTYREFIEKNESIVLGICGHFHENEHKEDKINKAKVINPGCEGEFIEI